MKHHCTTPSDDTTSRAASCGALGRRRFLQGAVASASSVGLAACAASNQPPPHAAPSVSQPQAPPTGAPPLAESRAPAAPQPAKAHNPKNQELSPPPKSAEAQPSETQPGETQPGETQPSSTPPEAPAAARSEGSPSDAEPQLVFPHVSVVAKVGRNHGHVLNVSRQDVAAQQEKTYQLLGKSDHPHSLTITAAEFEELRQGVSLRKRTERGGRNAHRHRVLVRLEPDPLPEHMVSVCQIQIGGKDDHELVIPDSHLRGGQDRSYDIQGIAGHTHQLLVTKEHFAQLLAGQQLDLTTGRGALHFHHVYLSYRGPHSG